MKNRIFVSLFEMFVVVLLTLYSGCSFNNGNGPDELVSVNIVKTTITGNVIDEAGLPVADAEVSYNNRKTLTNKLGLFILKSIDVPENRFSIKVSKKGYFTAFRAEVPNNGSQTIIRIGLMSDTPQGYFDAILGHTEILPSSVKVQFPTNAYVTKDGKKYSGNVRFVIKHVDPTSRTYYDYFSGDLTGLTTNGMVTSLLSYGVIRVELSNDKGEPLQLASGKKATLTLPIPQSMLSSAPSTIPLWHFDEAKGIWKEESSATKINNTYVGDVEHFSDWNFDQKIESCELFLNVRCGEQLIPGIKININGRVLTTDAHRARCYNLAPNMSMKIKVYAQDNNGIESDEYIITTPPAGQSTTLDIILKNCPAFLTGELFNCEGYVTDGYLYGQYDSDKTTFSLVIFKGKFFVPVTSYKSFYFVCSSLDGSSSSKILVPKLKNSEVYNVGKINACLFHGISINKFGIGVRATSGVVSGALTADGTKYIMSAGGYLRTINMSDQLIESEIKIDAESYDADSISNKMLPLDISDNGEVALVRTGRNSFATYSLTNAGKMAVFPNLQQAHLSPDGFTVVGYGFNGNSTSVLNIYNSQNGNIIREITTLSGAGLGYVFTISDLWDDKHFGVVTSSNSGNFQIIDYTNGNTVKSINSTFRRILAQSADGTLLVVQDNNNQPGYIIDITNGQVVAKIPYNSSKNEYFYDYPITLSPLNTKVVYQLIGLLYPGSYVPPMVFDLSDMSVFASLPDKDQTLKYVTLSYSGNGKKLAGLYVDSGGVYRLSTWDF